jgi:hypothetical protein
MRCSGRLASAHRLQEWSPARTGCDQQAARRARAAADRGRYATWDPLMRSLTTTLVATVLGACGGSYSSALALWAQSTEHPEYQAYLATFVTNMNYQRLDDHCHAQYPGQLVDSIVLIDADGFITDTYTGNASAKAACIKAAFKGARVPVPPFSPFPILSTED